MKRVFAAVMMFSFLFVGPRASAENILPARSTTQTNVIVRQDASQKTDRPAVYNLKRWDVEADKTTVEHALDVYKKKAEPRYTQRIWITQRKGGQKRIAVEYVPRGEGESILFSPDEDFMYYLGLTPAGQTMVYGMNLVSDKKFIIGKGGNFQTVNCPGKTTYVVIQNGTAQTVYQVFTPEGRSFKTLSGIQNPADLEKSLCR